MPLDKNSKAYHLTYQAPKALGQIVAENPGNQFLADRLSEQRAALSRTQALLEAGRRNATRIGNLT